MRTRELLLIFAVLAILAVLLIAPVEGAGVYKWFNGLRVGAGAPTSSAINLASGTATSAGIAFGADAVLYRSAAAQIANNAKTYLMDDVTLGSADTKTITCGGRLILRTLGADPLDATPADRPAGSAGEIAIYSGKIYLCTDGTADAEVWVLVGPAG